MELFEIYKLDNEYEQIINIDDRIIHAQECIDKYEYEIEKKYGKNAEKEKIEIEINKKIDDLYSTKNDKMDAYKKLKKEIKDINDEIIACKNEEILKIKEVKKCLSDYNDKKNKKEKIINEFNDKIEKILEKYFSSFDGSNIANIYQSFSNTYYKLKNIKKLFTSAFAKMTNKMIEETK